MPTSVHIPEKLLKAVERRARALKISRNRLIVKALEREVREGSDWSADFFDRLRNIDAETAQEANRMLAIIRAERRSKGAPKL